MAKQFTRCINRRGFTLIEVLFSLSICLMIVLNATSILKTINQSKNLTINNSFFAIGAKQISQLLYTAKDITVGQSLQYSDNENKQYTISLHKNRVVKEPGFDIIIHDVDQLDFYQIDKNIYMHLTDQNNDYHYLIATDYQGAKQDEALFEE